VSGCSLERGVGQSVRLIGAPNAAAASSRTHRPVTEPDADKAKSTSIVSHTVVIALYVYAICDSPDAMMNYRAFRSACDDAATLMATVFLIPVAILIVGAPIALCVRAVVEILRRL
jgi:hypothetical protein